MFDVDANRMLNGEPEKKVAEGHIALALWDGEEKDRRRSSLETYVHVIKKSAGDRDELGKNPVGAKKEKRPAALKDALDYEKKLQEIETPCDPIARRTLRKERLARAAWRFVVLPSG